MVEGLGLEDEKAEDRVEKPIHLSSHTNQFT
jgi:hypothetical protein